MAEKILLTFNPHLRHTVTIGLFSVGGGETVTLQSCWICEISGLNSHRSAWRSSNLDRFHSQKTTGAISVL